MMLIANKGCTLGPEMAEYHNHPDLINTALDAGFMSTADICVTPSGWYLGAEDAYYSYKVDSLWVAYNRKKLILIPTNVETMQFFASNNQYHWFMQKEDSYSLTSFGYIWTSNKAPVNNEINFIVNDLDLTEIPDSLSGVAGICSNYIGVIKENK